MDFILIQEMTYEETIDFLFNQLAMYQRIGSSAYKPGLGNALRLDEAFGSPSRKLKSVHIAGTNGKGSTAHTLAAILQSAGYRTGLYTSPHLVDFRERIRVDGEKISKDAVVDFTERYLAMNLGIRPSFFELTMTMAFEYFCNMDVDIAVIETGLGGRLDSTNIITPLLSIITNISYDHMAMLGNTLKEIAYEKAGIIKPGIPVVIGEAQQETRKVFSDKAAEVGAPIRFASEDRMMTSCRKKDGGLLYEGTPFGTIRGELAGNCQEKNAATIMASVEELRKCSLSISDEAVAEGFANVCELTGLAGRWMKVADNPLTICDTGHNIGGWEYISAQLSDFKGCKRIVVGFANDKDISAILALISRIPDVTMYAAQASVPRALPSSDLVGKAEEAGIRAIDGGPVKNAYLMAREDCTIDDILFVGGSNFVVADFLEYVHK